LPENFTTHAKFVAGLRRAKLCGSVRLMGVNRGVQLCRGDSQSFALRFGAINGR